MPQVDQEIVARILIMEGPYMAYRACWEAYVKYAYPYGRTLEDFTRWFCEFCRPIAMVILN